MVDGDHAGLTRLFRSAPAAHGQYRGMLGSEELAAGDAEGLTRLFSSAPAAHGQYREMLGTGELRGRG